MKRPVLSLLAGMMIVNLSALPAVENPAPPDIKPGPPAGSCCRVLGNEGASEQRILDGELVWSCHMDPHFFAAAWDVGLLPYSVLENHLTGSIGTWSPWFNRDRPSGVGDYELDQERAARCANPIMVECQTAEGEIDWRDTDLVYHCDPLRGGYCVNKEQAPGQFCEDFKVRFLCINIDFRL